MATRYARVERLTLGLFALNVALQIADALATYAGCIAGWSEGNPVIRYAMESFGLGPGLALAKCTALGFLGYLWAMRRNRLVPAALGLTAVVYIVFSVVPWSVALLRPPST